MFQETMFHDCMLRRVIFQIYSVSGPDPVSIDPSREVCLCLAGQTLQEGSIGTLHSLKFSGHSGGLLPGYWLSLHVPPQFAPKHPFSSVGS